jgi:hypothetical protein
MSIERERYEQMTNGPGTIWGRFKSIFVFPPLSREEPPATAPIGGPIETPAPWHPRYYPKPPGPVSPTDDEVDRVARELHEALFHGTACVSPTWIPDEPEGFDLGATLPIDGEIRLRELAKAAITAVQKMESER